MIEAGSMFTIGRLPRIGVDVLIGLAEFVKSHDSKGRA